MNDSRLASRYARALFQLAAERNLSDAVRQDLAALAGLVAESAEFRWLLDSPVVNATEKARITDTMLRDKVQPVTLDFLRLLIRHRRESNLLSTCRMFLELYKADQGILEARVETAIPVDDRFIAALKEKLSQSSGRKIEIGAGVNENLIGGFILTLEDQQLDASVQSKLKKIRQELRESKK